MENIPSLIDLCASDIRKMSSIDFKLITMCLDEAVILLKEFKSGDCFCEVGIGNTMLSSHTSHCIAVQRWFKHWGVE